MDLGFAITVVHFKNHASVFLKAYPVAMLRVGSHGEKTKQP